MLLYPCRRSPPPPARESFFKSLNGLRVLLGVLRTWADVGKAKFLKDTANRHLIEIDIEEGRIHINVSEQELDKRRAGFRASTPRHTTGVLAKYAKLVTSASKGARCIP